MSPANPKVDGFLARAKSWREEMTALREIVRESGLTEELKWGVPCYALDGKNVVLIHAFKAYCALLFVKGALMRDAENLLIRQTENVQSPRQIRFADLGGVAARRAALQAYIREAIEIERSGRKMAKTTPAETPCPAEFQARLDAAPELRAAFDKLTPGRRRGYLLHFADAKQAKTREARIDKWTPHILAGKGIDD